MKRLICIISVLVLVTCLIGCTKQVESTNMKTIVSSGIIVSGSYTGGVEDGKMSGKGSFTSHSWLDSWTYTGSFKDGLFNGFGKIKTMGYIEEGIYKDGIIESTGKRYDEFGNIFYEGDYQNGRPNVKAVQDFNTVVSFGGWDFNITNLDLRKSIGDTKTENQFVLVLASFTNKLNIDRQVGDFFLLGDKSGRVYTTDDLQSIFPDESSFANIKVKTPTEVIGPYLTANDIIFIFEVPADITEFYLFIK